MSLNAARRKSNATLTVVEDENVDRYEGGWRAGKPVEDPEKLKRWGFVTAKPSEYLICIKRGKIHRRSSGQGARVFKWPWESVSIVPTTLQRVEFVADQITRERVGVQVTGIAVYRITDPEIAFKVLNFSFGERAGEKLRETLREMFIGAARRLVANLALDDCLMKRKEAIATFLMQEIAPVVSGRGSPEDTTDRGWGVVIDTIEIQDVKVKSEQVFNNMQAAYRAELSARAARAELDRERELAERQADNQRRIAEAEIESARQTRLLRAHAEAEAALAESTEQMRAEHARAQVVAAEMERREAHERRRIEVDEALALRHAERNEAVQRLAQEQERQRELAHIAADEEKRRRAADAELRALAAESQLAEQAHIATVQRLEQERQRERFTLESQLAARDAEARVDATLRRQEAATCRIEHSVDVEHARGRAEVERLLADDRVLSELAGKGLPAIAEAFAQSIGTVHYTHLGGGDDAGPSMMIGSAIAQVLAVARSFGLDPERLSRRESPRSSPEPVITGTPVDKTPD
ncbi:MAG: hypothetical protein ABIJ09_09925 [Pseudomonadota bacterium]